MSCGVGMTGEGDVRITRISFDGVLPEFKISYVEKGGRQFLPALAFLKHLCKLEDRAGTERMWMELAKLKEIQGEVEVFRIEGKGMFTGITFVGMIRMLGLLPVPITSEERVGITKVLQENYKGDARGLGVCEEAPVRPAIELEERPVKKLAVQDGDVRSVRIEGMENGRIRVVGKDGKTYVSTRDIIKFQCEKNNRQTVETWKRMRPEFKGDLGVYQAVHVFAGSGEVEQPVLEPLGALELVMFLDDGPAERNRAKMLAALRGLIGESGEEHEKFTEAVRAVRERARVNLAWLDRVMGQLEEGGAKRARRV